MQVNFYDVKPDTAGKTVLSANVNDALCARFGSTLRRLGLADGAKSVVLDAQFADANDGIGFMISQLAFLEPQMYEQVYADLFFDKVVPIRTDIPEWANQYQYISYNSATRGKFIGSHAGDLPTTAMERMLHGTNFGYGGLSLSYALDDMRKAVHLGMNLDSEQAQVAYRGAKEHQQDVVFYGDSHLNITGFLNNESVRTKTSKLASETASVKELADEINKAISEIWVKSNQAFLPDTVCMNSALYARLAQEILPDMAVPMTALQYLQRNNLYTQTAGGAQLQIIPMPHLSAENMKAHGLTAKTTMVVYCKNPRFLTSFMPIAPRFIAPQPKGLEIITPMEYKFGGTEFRYPLSAMYVRFAD